MLEANFEDSAMEAADNDDIALTTEDIEENDLETAVVENDGSETAYNEDAIMEAAGCEDDILEAVGSEDEEHQGWHLNDYFSPCFCLLFFFIRCPFYSWAGERQLARCPSFYRFTDLQQCFN